MTAWSEDSGGSSRCSGGTLAAAPNVFPCSWNLMEGCWRLEMRRLTGAGRRSLRGSWPGSLRRSDSKRLVKDAEQGCSPLSGVFVGFFSKSVCLSWRSEYHPSQGGLEARINGAQGGRRKKGNWEEGELGKEAMEG